MDALKYTKIIATLGPASGTLESIDGLITAGVDCFRLNFSHADGEAMQPLIDRVRQAAAGTGGCHRPRGSGEAWGQGHALQCFRHGP